MRREALLLCFVMVFSGPAAAETIWLEYGGGHYNDNLMGGAYTLNVMPDEWDNWGVALRYGVAVDANGLLDCLFQVLGTTCNDAMIMYDRSLLAKREFADGRMSAGIGLGMISASNVGVNKSSDDVVGVPFSLTVRTKSWRYFGLSASLVGNINEIQNYYGLNLQFEFGKRYRD